MPDDATGQAKSCHPLEQEAGYKNSCTEVKMKKIAILIAGIMIAGMIPIANASDTATITVTVTPSGTLSITVNPTTWANGQLSYGSSNSTTGGYFNVTNDGTVSCKVQIKASDTADWTLGSSAGYNQFVMQASTDGGSTWSLTLSTTFQDLFAKIDPSAYSTFDLKLTMPTSGSSTSQQTITVTLQAVST